jgi:hypothetical protein
MGPSAVPLDALIDQCDAVDQSRKMSWICLPRSDGNFHERHPFAPPIVVSVCVLGDHPRSVGAVLARDRAARPAKSGDDVSKALVVAVVHLPQIREYGRRSKTSPLCGKERRLCLACPVSDRFIVFRQLGERNLRGELLLSHGHELVRQPTIHGFIMGQGARAEPSAWLNQSGSVASPNWRYRWSFS